MANRRTDIVIKPMTTEVEWKWVSAYNKFTLTEDTKGIIAYRDDIPVAAVTYHNWEKNSVECHHVLVKPMILRHNWLEITAEAAFGEDRQVIYGIVPTSSKSFSYLAKLGFKETGRIPNGRAPGVDFSIQTLQREDCKYLKENSDG